MLYRGSEIMREVAWVIYDEIHYMRDKDRGVVWEESIILLPHSVRFVFLSVRPLPTYPPTMHPPTSLPTHPAGTCSSSFKPPSSHPPTHLPNKATIPNSQEFAGWIATIHHQPCHVVYTDYRPVPLQHYIFPSGGYVRLFSHPPTHFLIFLFPPKQQPKASHPPTLLPIYSDGLYLVVDEKSRFREDNFQKAMAVLQAGPDDEIATAGASVTAGGGTGKKGRKDSQKSQQSDLGKIVRLIMER